MKRTIFCGAALLLAALAARAQGWPQNYEGVMLQAFYWDSYDDTQWTLLTEQADDLSQYFDLIWVPNSGYCNSLTNQMGYLPVWWFDHKSAFGTEEELREMIQAYKLRGTGIIEDVVINHRNGNTNWCDFPTETWNGETMEWSLADICQGDDDGATEAQGYVLTGAADTGDDFNGGRDLDHTSDNVQKNVRLYLDFLLDDLGYSGFRLDMVKGYDPQFTALYNQASQPTYSVGEYWDSSVSAVVQWIEATAGDDGEPTSAAFNFPLKYDINSCFGNEQWSTMEANYLIDNYPRYTVNFVDNHDTYRTGESSSCPLNANIEAANAFILAMPGTPCVFLRHLQMYEVPIKKLIFARKAAGVSNGSHIYSTVHDTENNGTAFVTEATWGQVLLTLGSCPSVSREGFQLAVEGTGYQFYVSESIDLTGIDDIVSTAEEKTVPDFCTIDDGELCAFFEKPEAWTGVVRCWAWNSTTNFTGGSWPGTACSYVGSTDDGLSVYKWSGGTLTDNQPTGIIFNSNSGSTQTNDLEFANGGYYDINGLQGTAQTSTGIENLVGATFHGCASGRPDPALQPIYTLDGKLVGHTTGLPPASPPAPKGIQIIGGKKYAR